MGQNPWRRSQAKTAKKGEFRPISALIDPILVDSGAIRAKRGEPLAGVAKWELRDNLSCKLDFVGGEMTHIYLFLLCSPHKSPTVRKGA